MGQRLDNYAEAKQKLSDALQWARLLQQDPTSFSNVKVEVTNLRNTQPNSIVPLIVSKMRQQIGTTIASIITDLRADVAAKAVLAEQELNELLVDINEDK